VTSRGSFFKLKQAKLYKGPFFSQLGSYPVCQMQLLTVQSVHKLRSKKFYDIGQEKFESDKNPIYSEKSLEMEIKGLDYKPFYHSNDYRGVRKISVRLFHPILIIDGSG
jgi:hypothetical protein